jgi:ribonuclease HII
MPGDSFGCPNRQKGNTMNYRNSEGYPSPTEYEALSRIQREENTDLSYISAHRFHWETVRKISAMLSVIAAMQWTSLR